MEIINGGGRIKSKVEKQLNNKGNETASMRPSVEDGNELKDGENADDDDTGRR